MKKSYFFETPDVIYIFSDNEIDRTSIYKKKDKKVIVLPNFNKEEIYQFKSLLSEEIEKSGIFIPETMYFI